MRTFSIVCLLLAIMALGCFGGSFRSSAQRNGIVVSENSGSQSWWHASAHSRQDTRTYDNCLASIGNVPESALGMAIDTCIENSLVRATAEACPSVWGQIYPVMYRPFAWHESFGDCLARLDGMPEEQAKGLCARETVVQERRRLCSGGYMGYGYGGIAFPSLR